jgi:peptidoglycan-associated lipoprotein
MRVPLLILMFPLVTACSTMSPPPSPSASAVQPSGVDVAGRWRGHWTGTGIFQSYREDDVRVDLVQVGEAGYGQLVFQGTGAAEPVPWAVRLDGQLGTRVVAQVSPGTVTLRHHLDGRRFTADLKLSEGGERMSGFVRESYPKVGLVLTREPRTPVPASSTPAPQAADATPTPESQPQVAMVPAPDPETKDTEVPTERPKQHEFVAVQELTAIHFEFDKSELRSDALDTLSTHAGWLKEHADTAVLIEGHCDERGTSEYNVALGDRRANAVRDYLSQQGIASERLATVSYGKERPACAADTADCHEMNRRSEFRVKSH